MILLVIWLFIETRRVVNRERQQTGQVTQKFRKERCTYAIVSFFFGLSYFGRFFRNEFGGKRYEYGLFFQLSLVLVWFLEGASMGVLMLFHSRNFKSGSSLLSRLDHPSETIKPGELHFFSTNSVNNDNEDDEDSSLVEE